MKVGDLVTQLGWSDAGVGIIAKVYGHRGNGESAYASVYWPGGLVEMSYYDLEVVSESR